MGRKETQFYVECILMYYVMYHYPDQIEEIVPDTIIDRLDEYANISDQSIGWLAFKKFDPENLIWLKSDFSANSFIRKKAKYVNLFYEHFRDQSHKDFEGEDIAYVLFFYENGFLIHMYEVFDTIVSSSEYGELGNRYLQIKPEFDKSKNWLVNENENLKSHHLPKAQLAELEARSLEANQRFEKIWREVVADTTKEICEKFT